MNLYVLNLIIPVLFALPLLGMEPAAVWSTMAQGKKLTANEKRALHIQQCKTLAGKTVVPAQKKEAIRIATFNVHMWQDPVKKLNFQEIINTIAQCNADIIVLQEVAVFDQKKLIALFEELGYKHRAFWMTHAIGKSKYPFGTYILSKIPFTQKPFMKAYAADANKYEKRGFINAKINLASGQTVSLYGTHLDVWDNSGAQRNKEIAELMALTAKDTSDVIVLLGDWNALRAQDYQYKVHGKLVWELLVTEDKERIKIAPPTHELEVIAKNGFHDSFALAHQQAPFFTTWSGKRVDFIWVKYKDTNAESALNIHNCFVIPNAASDHFLMSMDMQQIKARSAL